MARASADGFRMGRDHSGSSDQAPSKNAATTHFIDSDFISLFPNVAKFCEVGRLSTLRREVPEPRLPVSLIDVQKAPKSSKGHLVVLRPKESGSVWVCLL